MAWSLPPIPAELAQALLMKQQGSQGGSTPPVLPPLAAGAPQPSADPTRAAFERMAQPGADPRRGGFASARALQASPPADPMRVALGIPRDQTPQAAPSTSLVNYSPDTGTQPFSRATSLVDYKSGTPAAPLPSQLGSGAMPRVPGDTMNVTAAAPPQVQPTMASTGPNQIAMNDPMRATFGIPRANPPAAPAPAPPSDDPAITGQMPKLPTAPDMSHAPILGLADKMTANLNAQQGLTPPDPNQLKPHWYDRILGGLVGGASGSVQAGGNVTNRRMINAAREYQSKLQPLEGQFKQMTEAGPVMESATKVPSDALKNQLDIRHSGIEQATQAETGRHNTAEEGISQQGANTAEAAQAETARHNPVMESAEQQRIQNEATANQNTATYQKGELSIDSKRLAQDKAKLDAAIGPIADVHTLDAEERQDSISLDKQEQEAANQIKQDYSGVGGFFRHGTSSAEDALKDSQKQFATLRQNHAQMFQQKRASIGGKGGATSAGTPPPGTKVATQQHVADYAKAKGITPEQATKEFTQSGYKIQ